MESVADDVAVGNDVAFAAVVIDAVVGEDVLALVVLSLILEVI